MNKSFNSFRAIAFFAVFIFHFNSQFSFGYLGVLAFFVLSGYLIIPIIIKTREQTTSLGAFLKNFYGRRALRIFPIYYLYLILIAILLLIIGFKPTSYYAPIIFDLPYTLTYTYNFYHISNSFQHCRFISHLWSLAVEEQFYLFSPLVLYFLRNKSLQKFLLATIIAGPLIRLLCMLLIKRFPHYFISSADTAIYVSSFSHIDAFFTGGIAALCGRNKTPKNWQLYVYLFALIVLGGVTEYFSTGELNLKSLGYPDFMPDSYKFIWGYTSWNFFFAILLIRLNTRDFLIKVFENNILNYLGKISYGLYIYHYPILHLVKSYLPVSSEIIKIFITLIVTVLVSSISFEFFEVRLLQLKNKLFPIC